MYDAPLPLFEQHRPRGLKFALCALTNLFVVSLGLTGLLLLAARTRSMTSVLLVVVLIASLISALQRLIWKDGFPSIRRWVSVSVASWIAGLIATALFSIGDGPTALLFRLPLAGVDATVVGPPPWWFLAGALVGGLIAGLGQVFALRGFARGVWWILLTMVSWGLGLYFIPEILFALDLLPCCSAWFF